MARTDLTIQTLGNKFVDLRDPIPGDSFNWSWVRPLSQVRYLAIHHTAGPDTQTPDQIANFHINNNGWGGIGYHFLVDKNGVVYYVGDISTARANVANLNDQVLGICLIGNFTAGREPTALQLDGAHKLCDFFINNYPALTNINNWDDVRGHKELPGQATACPGDNWPGWRPRLVGGALQPIPQPTPIPQPQNNREQQIRELYRTVLGREADPGGLNTYLNSPLTIEDIKLSMIDSDEHKRIVDQSHRASDLENEVSNLRNTINSLQNEANNLKMTLSSLNEQVDALKQTYTQKLAEVEDLKRQLEQARHNSAPEVPPIIVTPPPATPPTPSQPADRTYSLVNILMDIYKILVPVRKVGG